MRRRVVPPHVREDVVVEKRLREVHLLAEGRGGGEVRVEVGPFNERSDELEHFLVQTGNVHPETGVRYPVHNKSFLSSSLRFSSLVAAFLTSGLGHFLEGILPLAAGGGPR